MYSLFLKLWLGGSARKIPISGLLVLALIPLTFILQVSGNMIAAISSRIIETESYHAAVFYQGTHDNPAEFLDPIGKSLLQIEGVEAVYAEQRSPVIVANDDYKQSALLRKLDPALFDGTVRDSRFILLEGRFPATHPSFSDSPAVLAQTEVLVARALAEELALGIGDDIRLVVTAQKVGILPKIRKATVVGVFTTGYETLDKNWVIGVYDGAGILFSEYRTGIHLENPFALANNLIRESTREQAKMAATMNAIEELLPPNAYVSTWYDQNYGQFTLFAETQQLLFLVAFIAVLLAVVTLSSTIGIRLLDMNKSIAVLKSMGFPQKSLSRYLVLTGLLYGLVSSIIASALGLLLSWQVNLIIRGVDKCVNVLRSIFGKDTGVSILSDQLYLDYIPFSVDISSLLFVAACTVVLCALLTLFPSRYLAKVRPVIVLKG